MGIVKCSDCGTYINDEEAVWVEIDDTHDKPYCVSCAPEMESDDNQFDYEE